MGYSASGLGPGGTPGASATYPIISRMLDTTGDGTGTQNANGAAQAPVKIAPGAGEVFVIERMLISVGDTTGMTAQEYGNLGATRQVAVRVGNLAGERIDYYLTDPAVSITSNAEYGTYCYDVDLKDWGAGNQLLVARWTFSRSGRAVVLDGDNSDELWVEFNSGDFSGLLQHYFLAQGYQKV